MIKKDLIAALAKFDDNDHIAIDDLVVSYIPALRKICGKREHRSAPYYCGGTPGHSGKCYCPNKRVDFDGR